MGPNDFLFAAATAAPVLTPSPSVSPMPLPPSRLRIWRCELPGGTYEVALRAIVSVSVHEYVIDGARRVTVSVNRPSIALPPSPKKLPAGSLTSRPWKRVVKIYPTTTHAHTIEYRVESDEQLKQIFASAQRAFESGNSATYRPPTPIGQ